MHKIFPIISTDVRDCASQGQQIDIATVNQSKSNGTVA
jgi:hypothetical protein